jgi:hypothetical protein
MAILRPLLFVSSDNSDGDVLVVFATCLYGDDELVLDSGASFHICCNKDWFSSYEFVQTGDFVRVGDNTPCQIMSIGSVQIKTHDGMICTLTGVEHIPIMARNLISLSITSQDVRLEINRKPKCALHSCIENLGNLRAFK